jgi:hypothetical protein
MHAPHAALSRSLLLALLCPQPLVAQGVRSACRTRQRDARSTAAELLSLTCASADSMPPRCSARLAADAAPNGGALLALPLALVLAVFSLLPVDARARCAAVCRAWRAALLEPSLWQHLNVSPTSGVTRPVTAALLAGAAARAHGSLRTLDVSGCAGVSAEALLAVATANAATLRELRMGQPTPDQYPLRAADFEALLHAAPLLRVSNAGAACRVLATACRMLRNEGIFERLHLRGLCLFGSHDAGEEAVLALAAAVPSQASLTYAGDRPAVGR